MTTLLVFVLFVMGCLYVVHTIELVASFKGEAKAQENSEPWLSTYGFESLGAVGRMLGTLLLIAPIQLVRFAFDLQSRAEYYSPEPFWVNVGIVFSEELTKKVVDSLLFAFIIGFAPILWSLITLWIPGLSTGAEEARKLGARRPVEALGEVQAIDTALGDLRAVATANKTPFSEPVAVLVSPHMFPGAYTVGRIIYLHSGLFKTNYLKTALAHELGHLTYKDGRLLLALRRLIIPLAYWFGIDRSPKPAGLLSGGRVYNVDMGDDAAMYYKMKTLSTKMTMAFLMGGLGLLYRSMQWADAWKVKDFRADAFACKLGEGQNLKQFLSEYQELETAQPYLLVGRPYAAERIEQITKELATLSGKSEGVQAYEKLRAQAGIAQPKAQERKLTLDTPVTVTSLLGLLGVGDLKEWLQPDGATVKKGEVIARITLTGSDYVAEEVTATANGTLRHKVSAGAEVEQEATIAVIEPPLSPEEQRQVAEVQRLMSEVGTYIKKQTYTKAEAATFTGVLNQLEALNQKSLHQDTVRELIQRGRQLLTERTQPNEQRGKSSS